MAASYNRSLWRAIGEATSTEGRGKNNHYTGSMYQVGGVGPAELS